MPSTVSVARSWPPAPIVEDEAESVLHEIFEDGSAVNVNRDDVSIVSRGSVDQYPILVPVEVQEPFPALADSNGNHTWNVKASHTTLNAGSAAPRSGSLSRASSISGPHSTKKKTNKVRFAEPVHDRHKPKVQPGVEYLSVPASYARESAGAQDHDTYQRRPSRSEVDQLTHNSRRYSQRPAENYNNLDDVRQSTRRLSWNTWEEDQDGNVSWIKERKYEWHSDDEISSYRGTHYKHWRESSRIVTERISTEVSPVRSSSQRYIDAPDRSGDRGAINGSNESVASSTGRRTSTMNGAAASAAKYNNAVYSQRGRTGKDSSRREHSRPPTSRGGSEASSARRGHSVYPQASSNYDDVRAPQSHVSSRSPAAISGTVSRPRSSSDGIRRPVDSPKFSLSPCPRSIPMAGYREWYTFIGLTHLDICPSCASQIEATRFRDLFIPSLPKPADAKIRCSFSQPWARLAFVQTMKLGLNHLELLYQITRPPIGGQPCTGRVPSLQSWYRVSDLETGRTISDFNACSACFRNLSILMPSLRDSFRPGPIGQERICDLRTDSTRFIQYLDLFDAAVTRSFHDPHRYIDLRDFIRYAKRKNKMYDCPRDHIVVGSWHYIPELPEFTICEDCYDDVVWPIANGPIANRITRTLQRLPGGGKQASCYLYSPRMRAKFREAVKLGDFGSLKAAVLKRYGVETKFRERKKLLLEDVARGYDRDRDLRLNAEGWKRNE
ncbi:conserved hypothetical protein [Coccidioides posadasii str. Silveira]|uniref:Uncharacterized protein n=1 Tax=Coccidioides posadasii (strain RMSCC 757 / Silveira) TaxID=443226 RepID=E9D292_COCPS|nr:conserved hypothetical protein [Coccidioides posadasii str. Silveira]